MKKFVFLIAALITAAITLNSCQESPTAGNSLVKGQIEIVIDSAFTVTAQTDSLPAVDSRTIVQILGAIRADGYGTMRSDVVCQYMPSSTMDTVGVTTEMIDSIHLILTMAKDAFTGDSAAPVGVAVHRLVKQLPYPLQSNFDPTGYYDPSPIGSTVYTALIKNEPTVHATSGTNPTIYKDIDIKLPRELAVDFYKQYLASPATFQSPQAFANYFPGLFITTNFGSGRITRFAANTLNIFYRSRQSITTDSVPRDTIISHVGTYMGVTPEVNTNNNISFTPSPKILQQVKEGRTLLVGPIGYDVQFTFPAKQIIDKFKSSGDLGVVNSLSFTLPAKTLCTELGFNPPPYVLLVKKSQRKDFFTGMKLTDNINSFYAAYDYTNQCYSFGSMRDYINNLLTKKEITAEDTEFIITPIAISFFTSTDYSGNTVYTLNTITPYVFTPIATELDFKKAKIEFSYSKQSL